MFCVTGLHGGVRDRGSAAPVRGPVPPLVQHKHSCVWSCRVWWTKHSCVARGDDAVRRPLLLFTGDTIIPLAHGVRVRMGRRINAELHGAAAMGNPGSLLAAGSFGFLANVAGLGVVQHGGALTLTVLSLLKNGAVILLAVALYADPVTVHSVGGYTVATYGFVMYQEARAKASAAAAASQGNLGGFGDGVGGENNVNNVNNFESGVGLVGGTAVYLGGAVPMGSVGIDLGGMERVVSGHGDGADVMSASSSARSLQVSFFFSFFLFIFTRAITSRLNACFVYSGRRAVTW